MVIDFYNRGGGGGGTADYATEAGSSRLLEGTGAFPQSATTGDVVAIGEAQPTRGLRTASIEAGVYQYDGSDWNKIGEGGGDFSSLMPLSEFPQSAETGEVVAIVPTNTETAEFNVGDFITAVGNDDLWSFNLYFTNENYLYVWYDYKDEELEVSVNNGANNIYIISGTVQIPEIEQGYYPISGLDFDLECYFDGDNLYFKYPANMYDHVQVSSSGQYDITQLLTRTDESGGEVGLYQYDGSDWNKVGSENAYCIELSSHNPEDWTQDDLDALDVFLEAADNDNSIVTTSYIKVGPDYYYLTYSDFEDGGTELDYTNTYAGYAVTIVINTEDLSECSYFYSDGAILRNSGIDKPINLNDGDVYATIMYQERPSAPDGQTVYGGSIEEFKAALNDNNNEVWVKTWDDNQHSDHTDLGYFTIDKNGEIGYYNYQGDKEIIFDDFPEGSWGEQEGGYGGVYIRRDGDNLYFYVWHPAYGVFFDPNTNMYFNDVGKTYGVYQVVEAQLPVVKVTYDGFGDTGYPSNWNASGATIEILNDEATDSWTIYNNEWYGCYYYFNLDLENGELSIVDGSDTEMLTVSAGTSGTTQFDCQFVTNDITVDWTGDNIVISYTASAAFENENIPTYEGVGEDELAKKSDIVTVPENRLVPEITDDGKWLRCNGWNGEPFWADSPREVPSATWDGVSQGKAVVATDGWASSYGWSNDPVVQSSDVLKIVKISVSDYDALVQAGTTDPNTLYLTYEPQV